jgi:dTDP-4-dehydrorhamnose reductase
MRLMVTGGAGVVGSELCAHLRKAGHPVFPVDVSGAEGVMVADLRDEAAVSRVFEQIRPDAVLHLAANKNVFFCEEHPEAAHAVNYKITEILTAACNRFNARMIFISSDYVFGGANRTFTEADAPCPTTQYGKDKAASEQVILKTLNDSAIVRTAGLYGFPGDLIQVVKVALSKGEPFRAFDNLINCPTWTSDLFRMIDRILDSGYCGIFHCVGPETLSRFDYACAVAEAFGLNPKLVLAEKLDFTKDVRPPSLRLDGTGTYERLGVTPGTLRENLKRIRDEQNR